MIDHTIVKLLSSSDRLLSSCLADLKGYGWEPARKRLRGPYHGSHLMLQHRTEPTAPTLALPVHAHKVRMDVWHNVKQAATDHAWIRDPRVRRQRVHSAPGGRESSGAPLDRGAPRSAQQHGRVQRSRSREQNRSSVTCKGSVKVRPLHVTLDLLRKVGGGSPGGEDSTRTAFGGPRQGVPRHHVEQEDSSFSSDSESFLSDDDLVLEQLATSSFDPLDNEAFRGEVEAFEEKIADIERDFAIWDPDVAEDAIDALVAEIETEMQVRCTKGASTTSGTTEAPRPEEEDVQHIEAAAFELVLRRLRRPLLHLQVLARAETLREALILPAFPTEEGPSGWTRDMWQTILTNAQEWR